MAFFDIFKKPDAETAALREASVARVADIEKSLRAGDVPSAIQTRLREARQGASPWLATLTPAELM
ncbi:MAG TPA: hypothetical protein VHY57_01355, partial [Rhizomicrobium sp.]|nr:hypothetical protein [Rhizomicrobium sp.]